MAIPTGPFFDHPAVAETVSHIWLTMGGENLPQAWKSQLAPFHLNAIPSRVRPSGLSYAPGGHALSSACHLFHLRFSRLDEERVPLISAQPTQYIMKVPSLRVAPSLK